jgi:hypothetical protein
MYYVRHPIKIKEDSESPNPQAILTAMVNQFLDV